MHCEKRKTSGQGRGERGEREGRDRESSPKIKIILISRYDDLDLKLDLRAIDSLPPCSPSKGSSEKELYGATTVPSEYLD